VNISQPKLRSEIFDDDDDDNNNNNNNCGATSLFLGFYLVSTNILQGISVDVLARITTDYKTL